MTRRKANLDRTQSELGYTFKNPDQALIALDTSRMGFSRLEFLGDSILGLAIYTLGACRRIPIRDADHLVSNRTLKRVFHSTFAAHSPSNSGDVVEALIGAVFLDGGFEAAAATTVKILQPSEPHFDFTMTSQFITGITLPRLMHLGAHVSKAVVAAVLCDRHPEKPHAWYSEERSRLLRARRLGRISRAGGLNSPHTAKYGVARRDKEDTDALDSHVAVTFLSRDWTAASQRIAVILRIAKKPSPPR